MDSSRDHRHRIAAAAQVDQFFDDYEIELAPEEALSFTATAPVAEGLSEVIYILVDVLNQMIPVADFGPNHPRTGMPHHKFRLGRRHGDRLIILEIFKGYLTPAYPFDELAESIRKHAEKAGCASFHWQNDENLHQFTFLWTSRNDQ